MRRASRVRVFLGEDERYRGRPLYEAILLAARERGLAGATVFRGFMGYGPQADVSSAGILLLADNLPVVVDVVDERERVESLLAFLKRSVGAGMVIRSEVYAEQVIPGMTPDGEPTGAGSEAADLGPAVRARVYLRDSATFDGGPAHAEVARSFSEAGVGDVSIHHGLMGFDRSSGMLSSRPLRFHSDLPVVVEAVGGREEIEAALPRVRRALERGLITLAGVELRGP